MKKLLLSLVLLCSTQALPAAKTPNIVFIFSDDHAVEAISAYGSWLKDHAKTPNIDKIAASGMIFHNMCVNNSICSPSRASIITGRYPHNTGAEQLHWPLPKESVTFVEKLKNAGWAVLPTSSRM